MRSKKTHGKPKNSLLRIPIRGYEKMEALRSICKSKLRIPIRGYEIQNIRRQPTRYIVTNPYKGLWEGAFIIDAINRYVLRIPIRGYEFCAAIWLGAHLTVTNPYKGLWVGYLHGNSRSHAQVTNPYKGLWAAWAEQWLAMGDGYESL